MGELKPVILAVSPQTSCICCTCWGCSKRGCCESLGDCGGERRRCCRTCYERRVIVWEEAED